MIAGAAAVGIGNKGRLVAGEVSYNRTIRRVSAYVF